MTRAERLTALLERLVEEGRIDVEQTADHFGVSAATIRRDLDHLADQQLLSRTHGGAVPNATSYDLPIRYKSSSRAEAKTRIAQRAVEMLWPGCTVAMNGGTTTIEIARAIPTSAPLRGGVTVVTNAINIATELTVRPFIKIVVCGGVARPQSYELVGSLASETLSQLTPDLCFLGATGIDADGGVSTN
ncbi:MAG TPA: DeoR/GlpR family DNA-binding transcription regulator, partial [Microlunatus sp.]